MRLICLAAALFAASPAAAHHEAVVVASALPLMSGVATITVAGLAAWRKRLLRRRKA